MAIRVKLDHLLLDRRLTLTELADRIGITIPIARPKMNKARAIRFSTLERSARARVPAGDLPEWTSDTETWTGGSHRCERLT